MNHKVKKSISMLMSCALIFSTMPTAVFASSDPQPTGYSSQADIKDPKMKTVIVTYDLNGGKTDSGFQMVEETFAGSAKFDFSDPSYCLVYPPAGMHYKGVEIEGKLYTPEERYSLNHDVTVKLIWEYNDPVTITHDANGGIAGPDFNASVKVPQGSKYTIPEISDAYLKAPKGHHFSGVELNGKPATVNTAYKIEKDTTVKYLWEKDPEVAKAKVTFKVVNGTWADKKAEDLVVEVPMTEGKGTLDQAQVPTGMLPAEGYQNGKWDKTPELAVTGDVVYTYTFEKAPVKTEATVTFKVVNGTWADKKTEDKQIKITMTDGKGTLDPSHIPTGMLPAEGYQAGKWDKTPNKEVTGNTVYTYTFEKAPEKTEATVTFKVVNGTWADKKTEDKKIKVALKDGKGTLEQAQIPTGMLPAAGYKEGAWDKTPELTVSGDVVYTYTFKKPPVITHATITFRIVNGKWSDRTTKDKQVKVELRDGKGTLDPKDIPYFMIPNEMFTSGSWDKNPNTEVTGDATYTYTFRSISLTSEATVTFRVVNGTWANGTTGDRDVTVKLYKGKGKLDKDDIPEGMIPKDGYTGGSWNRTPDLDVTGNVVYTYSFREIEEEDDRETYYVSIADDIKHGSISVNKRYPHYDDLVTITVRPYKDYQLDEIQVLDRKGNRVRLTKKDDDKYSFWMPDSKVTIDASFISTKEWKNPFIDVFKSDYFYDAVEWGVKNEMIKGTSENTFSPNMGCSRVEFVTFLWRLAGEPKVNTSNRRFIDIEPGSFGDTAIHWAAAKGITYGNGSKTFGPKDICTRAQAITFIHRFLDNTHYQSMNANFVDVPADSYYANAVNWAYANKITLGTGWNTFSPDAPCTRAQIVSFLYRAMNR